MKLISELRRWFSFPIIESRGDVVPAAYVFFTFHVRRSFFNPGGNRRTHRLGRLLSASHREWGLK